MTANVTGDIFVVLRVEGALLIKKKTCSSPFAQVLAVLRTATASRLVDLKDRLISTPPRDTSGANASDRFVYQHTWALCHLLELHISGHDYVVIFDHHEDVSVLDSEANPTLVKGYQVKTKDSGNYTVNAQLKREAGGGDSPSLLPSILGKLYDLKVRFPDSVKLLAVVSNSRVTSLENGKRKVITKLGASMKHLAKKAASGDFRSTRLMLDRNQRAQERAAEQQ
jgi:hypothetical protein